jgi:2-dehydro-3-deoxy-D-pentonate aldolase
MNILPPETRLHGIVPPLVTPLLGQDELDAAGLERLIEHVLGGGVHGLFILGTTGEGPALSYRLRRELIERTCSQVKRRAPVLVGISDTSLTEARKVAEWAAEAGAYAVVAAPPYYFQPTQAELQRYFDRLASQMPLPTMLYNMPLTTKVMIEPDTVSAVLDHPRIIGIKDSSANLGYLHQILRLRERRKDWTVLVGEEETLAYAIQAGADGGVNGGANVFPKLLVRYFDAATAGDLARCAEERALVVRLGRLYRIGQRHVSSGIKGIKGALNLLGVCNDAMTEPFCPFGDVEKQKVQTLIEELKSNALCV